MQCKKVVVVKYKSTWIPTKGSENSSGYDLVAAHDYKLCYNSPTIVKTGLFLAIPPGFEGQVRSRSGLALKGIVVLNSPGIIDSDYRGELGVMLVNLNDTFQGYRINRGDKVAQLAICRIPDVQFERVEELSNTLRRAGGFGFQSTGR